MRPSLHPANTQGKLKTSNSNSRANARIQNILLVEKNRIAHPRKPRSKKVSHSAPYRTISLAMRGSSMTYAAIYRGNAGPYRRAFTFYNARLINSLALYALLSSRASAFVFCRSRYYMRDAFRRKRAARCDSLTHRASAFFWRCV